MVESTAKYKSLSADSELSSGYEFLNKGEFTQCNKIIKKKLPKLKSAIDITNFNILKILLLDKMKKNKEKTKLLEEVKADFIAKPELLSDRSLVNYFKRILRSFDDDKGAQEIFKLQMKKMNFTMMDKKEQEEILKELTLNFDYGDIYSKVSNFIKNPNDGDVNFLLLLKYEAVYYLFLNKKFSDKILSKLFIEMIGNYDKLKDERGYFDLIAQYSIALKDIGNFMKFFEEKRTEFTNAPIDELKYDIYLSQGKYDMIIQNLIKDVDENRNECAFNSYERLINVVFWYMTAQLKIVVNITKVSLKNSKEFSYKEMGCDIKESTKFINGIFNLFEDIKEHSGRNLNAYKSCVLGELMLYHNMILMIKKDLTNETKDDICNLIMSLFDKAINKHSILFEVSKYFIYLNEEQRQMILKKYEGLATEKDIEKNIFYYKLTKLLLNREFDENKHAELISDLLEKYLQLTIEDIPLEKGERIPSDDLIVLANEYYYEHTTILINKTDLTHRLLIANIIAHEKSPYNYDISYYLLKTYGLLNLHNETLDILQYMNLKGPQFESVSYIAFPTFIDHIKGMKFLIENNFRWQTDNREKSKSTLWKMFHGRNFWNSEEMIHFIQCNQSSYYALLLEFFNIMILFCENYYPTNLFQEDSEENLNDFLIVLSNLITSFEEKEKTNSLINNQDLLVSLHKYSYDDYKYFNNDFDLLSSNDNYSKDNYRFEIDALNKENNYIYHSYPGYKNNYLKQNKISLFNSYDNLSYLKLRMNCLYAFGNIQSLKDHMNNKESNAKELLLKYATSAKECNSPIDLSISKLANLFLECSEKFDLFIVKEEEIYSLYTAINELTINKVISLRKEISFRNHGAIGKYISLFNEIKCFYCVPLTQLTSLFIDMVSSHKKEYKEHNKVKAKLNESFKAPWVGMLKDNMKICDGLINNKNIEESIIQGNDLTKTMKEKYEERIKGINMKTFESYKELFKDNKDMSKKMEEFIKQYI